jgi:predicted small integral membrane protein
MTLGVYPECSTGEWFQMWRSVEWNGLEPAFRNSVLAIFGLVLVHLPSPQWVTDEPVA